MLTLIGFSFTFAIFKKTNDRGFAFSKILTILLLSYSSWQLGHLSNLYTNKSIIVIFTIIIFASVLFYYLQKKNIFRFVKENKSLLIFEELLFYIFFIFFVLIRIGNPDLWHPIMGGEKPMDMAFINALVRSSSMPPYDPWLSGNTINYYYFGHLMVATLIKLTSIPSAIFYNIFIAFLFGQVAIGTISLVLTFVKSKIAAILGAVFMLICGNLAQIFVVYSTINSHIPINAWYWTSSRVMPNNEINEFPFFSFLYADLHSHVIVLPLAILFLALIIEISSQLKNKFLSSALITTLIASIVLGIIRMTNVWDYPSYLLAGSVIIGIFIPIKNYSLLKRVLIVFGLVAFILIYSHLSILAFLINFKTGELGLELYKGPQTSIIDYIKIHGLFLSVILSFLFLHVKIKNILKLHKIKLFALYLLVILIAIIFLLQYYFLGFIVSLMLFSLVTYLTNTKGKYLIPIVFFTMALILTSIPDLIDIKLGLGRMNTVFKFYFQAWIFYSISSAISIFYITGKTKDLKIYRLVLFVLFLAIFITSLLYPLTATPAKIMDRMGSDRNLTLDGTHYMNNSTYTDNSQTMNLKSDKDAIDWINHNIQNTPVILEANTPVYRWGGRVSIYTGLPTVLGWDWHEIAHRQYLPAENIQKRADHIRQIYESEDFELTKQNLLLYNVSYIYLGQLERAYYSVEGFEKVAPNNPAYFEQVFKSPDVVIYKFLNGKYY